MIILSRNVKIDLQIKITVRKVIYSCNIFNIIVSRLICNITKRVINKNCILANESYFELNRNI